VIPEAALRPWPILGFTAQPRECRCEGAKTAGGALAGHSGLTVFRVWLTAMLDLSAFQECMNLRQKKRANEVKINPPLRMQGAW